MQNQSSKEKSLPGLTKYQKYDKAEIRRSQIKNAPYNPRRISDQARKKLKEKIAKVGLINSPVWNKRTGNLVGGHQRLTAIDSLEHGADYLIAVDVIDVDEKTEKEMNVFLNNTSAMGEWDLDLLGDLIKDDMLDAQEFGFDLAELDYMTDGGVFKEENEKARPEGEKLKAIKESRKKLKESNQKKDDEGFYAIVVFQDRDQLEAFVKGAGYPEDERYLDGRVIAGMSGLKLP